MTRQRQHDTPTDVDVQYYEAPRTGDQGRAALLTFALYLTMVAMAAVVYLGIGFRAAALYMLLAILGQLLILRLDF